MPRRSSLITRQGLDFYTGLFQGDYPFAKYDQVFVPEYSVGATENVGCVVISDELLFRSRVTDALHELRAMVILHEMAHMWFGDLVTMKWWDDLWLNESFAEFCGTLASAEATRFTDAWTTFCAGRKTWGYLQDQLPSTHPIAADVPTLSQAVANFDGISYAKGASVLRQLAALRRPGAFLAGIRAYFAEHAWGNATLADLLAALEASSGVEPGGLVEGLAGDRRPEHAAQRVRGRTAAGRSRRSRCCRRPPPSIPRCGRTTSRSACTAAVGRLHWPAVAPREIERAGARTEVPQLAGRPAARPDPAQRR